MVAFACFDIFTTYWITSNNNKQHRSRAIHLYAILNNEHKTNIQADIK